MENEYSKHTPYLVLFIGLFSVLVIFISTFKRAYSFYAVILNTTTFNITAQESFAIMNTGTNVNSALRSAISSAVSRNDDVDNYEGLPIFVATPSTDSYRIETCYGPEFGTLVSASNSSYPIYVSNCEEDAVWFLTLADTIYLNEDSSKLFGEDTYGAAYWKYYVTDIDFSKLNTSMVKNAAYMFGDSRNLNIDSLNLNKWLVNNITNMAFMFSNASMNHTSDYANISIWNVQNVTNAYYMFFQTNITIINMGKTNWSSVTNATGALAVSNSTFGVITPMNIKTGTNFSIQSIYADSEGFVDQSTGIIYTTINSTTPKNTAINKAFSMLNTGPTIKSKITSLLSGWDYTYTCDGVPQMDIYTNSNCSDYAGTRLAINSSNSTVPVYLMHDDGCYMSFCTAARQVYANPNASYMFSDRNEPYFEYYNLTNLNTIYATNMYGMFNNCGITHLDIDSWKTNSVTNMASMFSSSSFYSVNNPTSVSDNLINLSGWNVKSVTNMSSMFRNTKYNGTINLQSWNTYQVRDMSRMFEHSRKYNIITNGWNTRMLNNTYNMFYYTNNLLHINMYSWNLYNVSVNANNTNMFTASAIRNFYSPMYIRAGINIALPRTFNYGGTSYTKLNSTTPKQVLFSYN